MRHTPLRFLSLCIMTLLCAAVFALNAQAAARPAATAKPAGEPAAAAPSGATTPTAPQTAEPTPTATPTPPVAPASNAVRVAVEHEGTDTVGSRLSFQMKEVFNTSSQFALSDADTPKLILMISTEPEFTSRPSVGSAYSAVWAFSQGSTTFPLYLAREVGTVGSDGIADLAQRLAERTRGIAAKFSYLLNK